jgi:hypothetical protein
MSAEVLRKAARLMRERAEGRSRLATDDGTCPCPYLHPNVALAVADWLDRIEAKERARDRAGVRIPVNDLDAALAIARAYLGGQP